MITTLSPTQSRAMKIQSLFLRASDSRIPLKSTNCVVVASIVKSRAIKAPSALFSLQDASTPKTGSSHRKLAYE